jgi:hypothetical protein
LAPQSLDLLADVSAQVLAEASKPMPTEQTAPLLTNEPSNVSAAAKSNEAATVPVTNSIDAPVRVGQLLEMPANVPFGGLIISGNSHATITINVPYPQGRPATEKTNPY